MRIFGLLTNTRFGAVAQLGEHDVRNVGVAGSIPVSSTRYNHYFCRESLRSLTRRSSTG